jgi:hypothetical protein
VTRPCSILSLVLLCTACSSHGTPAHPTPGHDAGVATADPAPNDSECDALIDHAIDLQASGDPRLTDDDRKKLHAELRDHTLARCHAMPRKAYACAVGATTLDAFTSCDSAQP